MPPRQNPPHQLLDVNIKLGTVFLQYLYVIYPNPATLCDLVLLQSRALDVAPHVDQKVEFPFLDDSNTATTSRILDSVHTVSS